MTPDQTARTNDCANALAELLLALDRLFSYSPSRRTEAMWDAVDRTMRQGRAALESDADLLTAQQAALEEARMSGDWDHDVSKDLQAALETLRRERDEARAALQTAEARLATIGKTA